MATRSAAWRLVALALPLALDAGIASAALACDRATVVSTPGGEGHAVHITIVEDQDDQDVWSTVGAFAHWPSEENTTAVFTLLDDVLASWPSHPSGVVIAILDAIAEHRIDAGRRYLVRFAQTDPTKPHAISVIRNAARNLGKLGGPGAYEQLAALANDGPPEAASTAAVALGVLGDARAVPVLESLAGRADSATRQRALSALARYCVESSADVAAENTKHPDSRVRNSATWWLSRCATSDRAQLLGFLTGDDDSMVRANALRGLLRMGSRAACSRVMELHADNNITVSSLAREYDVLCGSP